MIKRSIASLLLSGFVFSCLAQHNGLKDQNISIFSVNKKTVSADEFVYLYRKNHQHKNEDFTAGKIEEYLNLFINFKLKVTEAIHRGMDTTEAFKREYNTYREELRRPYLPDTKLLDSLVKLTYNRMGEEVNASHILINLPPDPSPEDTLKAYNKIMDLRHRAQQGENFGTLAQSYSEDPSAKSNKGNLGYFTALQMVYPFEVAAYSTPKGQISMPVRTRFGYHVIFVNDRRPARGEVEVSHIMLRTGEEHDNNKARNLIFDIYDQLQKGVSWNELCKQYSDDPASKEVGGRLRPFGIGVMASVPEFERVAFELEKPGEVSDPFQTQFGWHIMRLERKIPLLPFDELAPSLKAKVGRDERVQISKHTLQEKLKRDFGFSEQAATKGKVFALADTTLKKGTWNPVLAGELGNETLFTLNGKKYAVKEFVAYARKNQRPNSLAPEKYMEQLFGTFVETSLNGMLEEQIIDKSPDYKWLLKEYYEGILLFEIMEKEVWNKATEDTVGQLKHYQANAAKYQAKERASARMYSSLDAEAMASLYNLVQQGDSAKIAAHVQAHGIKDDQGAYEKESRAVLGKIEWKPGTYKAENNDLHYVIIVDKILPPGPQTFDEARPEVISDFQNYLEKNWVEKLRKKYAVKVDKKGKQYAWNQLLKS